MDRTESSRDKTPDSNRINGLLVSKRVVLTICLLLVASVVLVYKPVLKYYFVNFDDLGYIVQNPPVQEGPTWETVKWAVTSFYAGNWHPFTWLSHALDCRLFELNPAGHHLTNVLLHAANSVLLFLLLRSLTAAIWRSAFVAALFALHPMHVESVAWIAERKDVLSTFFFILTIWAYAKYVAGKFEIRNSIPPRRDEANPKSEIRNRSAFSDLRSSPWYGIALVLFALGLMSKPMLVTLPFVLLLLDYWPLRRFEIGRFARGTGLGVGGWRFVHLLFEKLPFFALSAADCVLTFFAQRHTGAVASTLAAPLEDRMLNSVISYGLYLKKAFWPGDMAVYYPYRENPSLGICLGAVLLLLVLSGIAIWLLSTRPYVAVGWFWFVGTLVPVIGLVQVGLQSMADRYTYIPYIGLFGAITWGVADGLNRWWGHQGSPSPQPSPPGRGRIADGSLAKAGSWAGITSDVCGPWSMLQCSVVTVLAIIVLAACTFGTAAQLRFWRDSETLWRHTVAVTSGNAVARQNFGSALVEQRRFAEAAEQFSEALKVKPMYAEAESNYGFALAAQGRTEEALAHYRRALEMKPGIGRTHFLLGSILLGQGNRAEAAAEYKAALDFEPDLPPALNDLAWVLAADSDPSLRDGRQAATFAERACRLTKFRDPQLIGTLAAAYAEAGRFEEAVATANKAKELAAKIGRTDLVERNEELLQLYRAGKPYHEPPPKMNAEPSAKTNSEGSNREIR